MPGEGPAAVLSGGGRRTGAAGAVAPPHKHEVSDNGPSLTSRTASGFAWAVGQAVLSKGVAVVCQLVLARVLFKDDFGLAAVANAVTSFVAVLQYAGLQEILVQRQKHFDRWGSSAFWLSMCIGVGCAVLVAATGPAAAAIMHEPRLIGFLALTALGSLFSSLQIVPMAMLQIQLRMRTISMVLLLGGTGGIVATVVLALCKVGAYSLVLGPLIASPVVLVILWRLTRPRILPRPQARRWKYMFGDSLLLLGTGLVNNFTNQGANLILGLMHTSAVVGVYSFGYNLSLQTIMLLTQNLTGVFFPALSKLQGQPERMLGAFIRAARVLALVGMPMCALQAALAGPLMRLLFGDKWVDAIPVMQWLSLGLAFGILGSVATSIVKAAGMFKYLFRLTIAYTLVNLVMTTIGAALGGAREVAIATGVYFAMTGPAGTYFVLRPFGGTVRDVAKIYLAPAACSLAAFGAGVWTQANVPAIHNSRWLAFVTTPAIGAAVYLPLAWATSRGPMRELIERVRGLRATL